MPKDTDKLTGGSMGTGKPANTDKLTGGSMGTGTAKPTGLTGGKLTGK
jgi:hypothetical protein